RGLSVGVPGVAVGGAGPAPLPAGAWPAAAGPGVGADGGGDGEESGGHGLLGMRERATALGGSCFAGPRYGGGYRVHAILPVA
ncbi:two-component sensor histidine kinase, partial [Streptomyces goshikiensis]